MDTFRPEVGKSYGRPEDRRTVVAVTPSLVQWRRPHGELVYSIGYAGWAKFIQRLQKFTRMHGGMKRKKKVSHRRVRVNFGPEDHPF